MNQAISESEPQTCEDDRDQALEEIIGKEDLSRITLSNLLHKDIAGGLVVCTSLSELIRLELSRNPPSSEVERLHQNLDTSLRQVLGLVRDTAESLFPPVLKVFGLNAALQQLARQMASRFSGSLLLNLTGDEPALSLPSRLCVFRVMEGLLEICVRGAEVSWIEVACQSTRPNQLDILVDHDGSADLWSTEKPDLVMPLMHARCARIGAVLDVSTSDLGDRTRIALAIPLDG